MTEKPTQFPVVAVRFCARRSLVLLSAAVFLMSGCAARRRPAFPWTTAAIVRPTIPAKASPSAEAIADPVPELRLEIPPPPSHLAPRSVPARPRIAAAPSTEYEPAGKPEPPIIAPQLTPQEASAAQQQTNLSLSAAERNLEAVRGKILTAAQADLESKVRSFLDEAREAARAADWTRARNLAKKAEVLSEELVGSL
jgi:hypothetical protein